MNYEQIKRLRIEDPGDLKMFINIMGPRKSEIDYDGPALFSVRWLDAIYSGEEELSFKMWILTLDKISNYFNEYQDLTLKKDDFNRMYGFIEEFKIIISESKIKTLPFMHNAKKWNYLFFNSLPKNQKITFYAIHEFLVNALDAEKSELVSFNNLLENEDAQIRIGVKAYKAFMVKVLQI